MRINSYCSIRSYLPKDLSLRVLVSREEGVYPFVYPFAHQSPFPIHDKEKEWPCLLYRVRYVFEIDPLEQVRDRRSGWQYQQEGWEEPDPKYYYCRQNAQKLTRDALVQIGISF